MTNTTTSPTGAKALQTDLQNKQKKLTAESDSLKSSRRRWKASRCRRKGSGRRNSGEPHRPGPSRTGQVPYGEFESTFP